MKLLETTIARDVNPGYYWTRIDSYEECTPEGRKPYVAVHMIIDGLEVEDRWYASRIPYIMHCLRDQYNFACEMSLTDLLEVAKDHGCGVRVSYSAQYGRQIDYRYIDDMFSVDRYPEEL